MGGGLEIGGVNTMYNIVKLCRTFAQTKIINFYYIAQEYVKMSLAFVKSAVLTSSDGISHNDEVAVESTETEALRRRGDTKNLFAQLQENKELEAEAEEENRKAMRDAMTLNEEDCAHLAAVNEAKKEKELIKRKMEEEEIAVFRTAKSCLEMKNESNSISLPGHSINGTESNEQNNIEETHKTLAPLIPIVLGKRKKKSCSIEKVDIRSSTFSQSKEIKKTKVTKTKSNKSEEFNSSLTSLLGEYGSGSDSD